MLLQTQLSANHTLWYYNIFIYLFIAQAISTLFILFFYHEKMNTRAAATKLMQQQHAAKIDSIRKDHSERLEKIRIEMLKQEEDRTRQWIESEKETLHVLSGVSNLLDLSEKINRVESDKIVKLLHEIQGKVESITTNKLQ